MFGKATQCLGCTAYTEITSPHFSVSLSLRLTVRSVTKQGSRGMHTWIPLLIVAYLRRTSITDHSLYKLI
jgi:hypothetical protein